jgi:hypothetical protein
MCTLKQIQEVSLKVLEYSFTFNIVGETRDAMNETNNRIGVFHTHFGGCTSTLDIYNILRLCPKLNIALSLITH